MLKKLYDKSELTFAIIWIIIYCVSMSLGDGLSLKTGVERSISFIIGSFLSVTLLLFLKKHKLTAAYGLRPSMVPSARVLWYIPLVILLSANLWFGVTLNYAAFETVLYILTMLCVGFLEELIFRGLLFNAMKKDNPKAAVLVSSLTFGIGHIINLFNGSGAHPVSTLLQVIYAASAGFMFVMLYCKTKSLLACIITHGSFNALSVFSVEVQSVKLEILSCVFLTVITGAYGIYLLFEAKRSYDKK